MKERLTTDKRKIFARESLTLNSMTKDELRKHYNEIFDRLQEYEVAEEQGQLIRTTVKVGDIVYKVYDVESIHRQILEMEVWMIEVGNEGVIHLVTTKKRLYNFDKATFEDFGKTVFLTREEAEAKLKEGGEG